MIDLNSALITAVGALSTANIYWVKSWKTSTDLKLDRLDMKVEGMNERLARVEGRLNSEAKK